MAGTQTSRMVWKRFFRLSAGAVNVSPEYSGKITEQPDGLTEDAIGSLEVILQRLTTGE